MRDGVVRHAVVLGFELVLPVIKILTRVIET